MRVAVPLFGVFYLVLMITLSVLFADSEIENLLNLTMVVMHTGNALLCFLYAKKLERNGLVWGLAGFVLPFFSNIAMVFLSPGGGTIAPSSMISFLHDKTVCLGCGTVHPSLKPGKICSECGEKVLGFYAGMMGQKCDTCGKPLSDEPATPETRMGYVMEKRGLRCSKCYKLHCYTCSGVEASRAAAQCSCGGNLEIRI